MDGRLKDLLPYLKNPEVRKSLSLKKIAREAMFVPGTKLINDLMHDFHEKKTSLSGLSPFISNPA